MESLQDAKEKELCDSIDTLKLEDGGKYENRITLAELPLDVLMTIISDSRITFTDRVNLRGTCKAMKWAVSKSDYKPKNLQDFEIRNILQPYFERFFGDLSGIPPRWSTIMKGLPGKAIKIEEDRVLAYTEFICSLFRRAHFRDITVDCNFTPNTHKGCMEFDQLMQLLSAFRCEKLHCRMVDWSYHPRMFDVLGKVLIRKKLVLEIDTQYIKKEHLLMIPSVPSLALSFCNSRVARIVDDAIFLALVTKHRVIDLGIELLLIKPETILEARKIVEARGHDVSFAVDWNIFETMITGNLGLIMNGKPFLKKVYHIEVDDTFIDLTVFHKKGTDKEAARLHITRGLTSNKRFSSNKTNPS